MIVYEFPTYKNFSASEGYANIQVVEGKLKLSKEPDTATLNLIEMHGGKEVQINKVTRKRKEVK